MIAFALDFPYDGTDDITNIGLVICGVLLIIALRFILKSNDSQR